MAPTHARPRAADRRPSLTALALVLAVNALVLAGWTGWIVLTVPREVEGAGGLLRLAAVLVAAAAVTGSVVIGGVAVAVGSSRGARWRAGTAGRRDAVRLGLVATLLGLAPVVAFWLVSAVQQVLEG